MRQMARIYDHDAFRGGKQSWPERVFKAAPEFPTHSSEAIPSGAPNTSV